MISYLVARLAGQRRWPAALFGLTALLLGMVVALVKIILDRRATARPDGSSQLP